MRDMQISWVVWLGAIAITGILAVQTYWGMTTWTANESDINQKIHLALRRVAENLAIANGTVLPAGNIIRKRTSNYWLVNIAYEIDAGLLEFYLRKELETLSVNLDFEYAIFDCSTDEMVYGAYCAYEPTARAPRISQSMPGYHAFTYYFGVKFPGRSGFLWGQFQVVLFFSVILLLTILFFSYALYVITRQKWLFAQQKDFINNMTHEFKTPLSSIQLAADYFLGQREIQGNERLLRYSRIIRDQNLRLNQYIERLLQLTRFEAGGFRMQLETIDIGPFFRDLAGTERIRFEERGGTLELTGAVDGLEIRADRFHLTNMISSLLDNALKFSGADVEVSIRLVRQGHTLLLGVADRGIGIPADLREKVFEKFFRIPVSGNQEVKGFGIGLYYVREVCQAHRWKVRILSPPAGTGTEVQVAIPWKG